MCLGECICEGFDVFEDKLVQVHISLRMCTCVYVCGMFGRVRGGGGRVVRMKQVSSFQGWNVKVRFAVVLKAEGTPPLAEGISQQSLSNQLLARGWTPPPNR